MNSRRTPPLSRTSRQLSPGSFQPTGFCSSHLMQIFYHNISFKSIVFLCFFNLFSIISRKYWVQVQNRQYKKESTPHHLQSALFSVTTVIAEVLFFHRNHKSVINAKRENEILLTVFGLCNLIVVGLFNVCDIPKISCSI